MNSLYLKADIRKLWNLEYESVVTGAGNCSLWMSLSTVVHNLVWLFPFFFSPFFGRIQLFSIEVIVNRWCWFINANLVCPLLNTITTDAHDDVKWIIFLLFLRALVVRYLYIRWIVIQISVCLIGLSN